MFFWSKSPFLRVVIFFILGILSGINLPGYASYVVAGIIVSGISLTILMYKKQAMLLKFNYLYGSTLSLIFLFFGYLFVIKSTASNNVNHLLNKDGGSYYTAIIVSDPQIKGNFLRFKIEVQRVKDSTWYNSSGVVLAYLRLPMNYKPGYGDNLLIKGFPQRVAPPLNPEEFNYRRYLAHNKIYHQHFINSNDILLLTPATGFSLRGISIKARNYLEKKLTHFIPQPEELAVAKALILGQKEDLDNNTREVYAKAGAMHVLAVSGLHVGIIYIVLLGLLKQKQGRVTNPVLVAAIVIPALWAYAFITGLSPSVLRAVTMFSFLALAQVLNRRSASLNTLAMSAFILLLVNPYMIMAVGFQLSYIAVAGIIFLFPVFERWLNPSNPILRFIWQITALSMAAQLVTAPLSAFYFHRFPTFFLFTNLMVIPAAILIVWGGMALLTLGSVSATLGVILGKILAMIIWLLNQVLHWLAGLPLADINDLVPTMIETWILYGLIIFIFLFFTTRKWGFYWLTLGLLSVFCFNFVYYEVRSHKLKQLVFYSVNRSWGIDFIEDRQYYFLADSMLLADVDKIEYQITPYRLKNGLSPSNNIVRKFSQPDLGEIIVWQGKHILLAIPCLREEDSPQLFDFVLYKVSRTQQNCYQEQILLRKFVNNQVLSYAKYNLRSQGALIVDI